LHGPILLVATLTGAGTLLSARWLRRGATERAMYALAATWSVVLLLFCGWLVPRAEPYRTSRVIGERLAYHAARLHLQPVLLNYQEPGLIYGFGRPAIVSRDRQSFFACLAGDRSVLTVVLPSEAQVMRSHFGLEVTPIDQVRGFVLSKGQQHTLQLAVVRQAEAPPPSVSASPPTPRTAGLEQTLVK
jgi:hypothetical protein